MYLGGSTAGLGPEIIKTVNSVVAALDIVVTKPVISISIDIECP